MVISHAAPSLFSIVIGIVSFCGVGVMTVPRDAELDELMKLAAEAVREALFKAHLTDEQAADLMRIQVGQLRRQLRAEPGNHLSIARLFLLPMSFWLCFGPITLFLVAKRSYRQIADDVQAGRR